MYIRRSGSRDVPEGYAGCAFGECTCEDVQERRTGEDVPPEMPPCPRDTPGTPAEEKRQRQRREETSPSLLGEGGDGLLLLLAVLLMSGEEIDIELIVILILLVTMDQNREN